jgi:hypothetical protein
MRLRNSLIIALLGFVGAVITAGVFDISVAHDAAAQTTTYGAYTSGTKAIVGKVSPDLHIPLQIQEVRGWQPIGFAEYTATTVKSFSSTCSGTSCVTLPAAAKHAIISISKAPISWRDDGVNPTATVGHEYAQGKDIVIVNSHEWLAAFRWVDTPAGASKVRVTYYKNLGE